MASKRKTPAEIRSEASALAKYSAEEREREGDPEGAGVLRDLTTAIKKMKLSTSG